MAIFSPETETMNRRERIDIAGNDQPALLVLDVLHFGAVDIELSRDHGPAMPQRMIGDQANHASDCGRHADFKAARDLVMGIPTQDGSAP